MMLSVNVRIWHISGSSLNMFYLSVVVVDNITFVDNSLGDISLLGRRGFFGCGYVAKCWFLT
jgi:hypothetical protein